MIECSLQQIITETIQNCLYLRATNQLNSCRNSKQKIIASLCSPRFCEKKSLKKILSLRKTQSIPSSLFNSGCHLQSRKHENNQKISVGHKQNYCIQNTIENKPFQFNHRIQNCSKPQIKIFYNYSKPISNKLQIYNKHFPLIIQQANKQELFSTSTIQTNFKGIYQTKHQKSALKSNNTEQRKSNKNEAQKQNRKTSIKQLIGSFKSLNLKLAQSNMGTDKTQSDEHSYVIQSFLQRRAQY